MHFGNHSSGKIHLNVSYVYGVFSHTLGNSILFAVDMKANLQNDDGLPETDRYDD